MTSEMVLYLYNYLLRVLLFKQLFSIKSSAFGVKFLRILHSVIYLRTSGIVRSSSGRNSTF